MNIASRRAALVASVFAAVAAPLAAARPKGPGGMDREGAMPRRLSHFLDVIEATPEQRNRVLAIAGAAMRDLGGLRAQSKSLRQRSMALLEAPTIDRAAAEGLRVQSAAVHESQSKRSLQAMLDAAEVLTPAQRTRAAEWIKQRMERIGGGRRGTGGFMRQSGELDEVVDADVLV